MKKVVIESPYAGKTPEETQANVDYTRKCMADSLKRGEAPYASHLLYTQPGILDDTIPAERAQGMEAGFIWGQCAELTAVYTDLGISPGMQKGIERAKKDGRPIEYRKIFKETE
jgi:hypothetical protein